MNASLVSLITIISISAASCAKYFSDQMPMYSTAFYGEWGFTSTCELGHYIGITLTQAGDKVHGTWSDGTNTRGSSGEVRGIIKDGKLLPEFCSDDVETNPPYSICPRTELVLGYFLIEDENLVWYQNYGHGFYKYAVLHRVTKQNLHTPNYDHCDE